MITSPLVYAELIIEASERMKKARDPDAAMTALDNFNALLQDHDMVHLMATTYKLLAMIFIEDTGEDACSHGDPQPKE